MDNAQSRLVSIRNELKAQKSYSGIAYSRLLMPENTPSQTYSGSIGLSGSGNGPLARVRFRFTRTDGLTDPPLVNFAFTASISPTYAEFTRSAGFDFTGNDLDYINSRQISGYIGATGDSTVDFYVDYSRGLSSMFFSINSLGTFINCQAIANVKGTLIEERII